jgi:hypothetical protein
MTQPATDQPFLPPQAYAMTEDQFQRFLERTLNSNSGNGPRRMAGLGAAPLDKAYAQILETAQKDRKGLGMPYECGADGFVTADVYQMLRLGSPRLALAKAWGVPMAPYIVNCRATFPTTSTSNINGVGNDQKIVQDTYVDGIYGILTNLSSTANQSTAQTASDYYYNQQNGINVQLSVVGAPRYSIAPSFTPVATLAGMLGYATKFGNGWVLTYQQQLMMNFQANIALPEAPYELCVTFQGFTPWNQEFVDMRNRDAIAQLRAEGYFVPDSYLNIVR